MQIHIGQADGAPYYAQIVTQVRYLIATGRLQPQEQLPPVRKLAEQLTLNPNTVARAYRELQSQEVLEAVRGTGLVVATGAAKRCRTDRVKLIRERLRQVLDEAVQSQIESDQLKDLIDREFERILEREGKA